MIRQDATTKTIYIQSGECCDNNMLRFSQWVVDQSWSEADLISKRVPYHTGLELCKSMRLLVSDLFTFDDGCGVETSLGLSQEPSISSETKLLPHSRTPSFTCVA